MNEMEALLRLKHFPRLRSPPVYNRTAAIADCIRPQVIFTVVGGDMDPFVVCIPKTKVAESAGVMKNVLISRIPRMDKIIPN